ncbi:MAG: acyl-CoA dehydrogenase [Comamonas sp. SCN 65-56]|uniref:acyl-CoA dehydrogenase family protein n=1 Tax=Comamonas sp. SCN 65-56 TaxID=1660095 RepID=UPI00086EE2F1|nr:acyl-CoA dehydrogenase family protein [Comamonas sp. SCN 65-56]ODS92450.1 MAG: acyl-CoA dehydrogenase [Comamonas sp. SCN 65-56]
MSAGILQATHLRPSASHLALPFFDEAHRRIAAELPDWTNAQRVDETDDRAACRDWVKRLGQGGWLGYCVPGEFGGALPELDSRALVMLRETLAFYSPLADFAFAMQGLGSGAISLGGSEATRRAYLPEVAAGRKIAAFALSEPEAGSDVAAMKLRATGARPDCVAGQKEDYYFLDGQKTWISNGGIADFYCVFAKTDPDGGSRGISAFVVDRGSEGLDDSAHIPVMAPHPLATLTFTRCRVSAEQMLGELNAGFKIAMQTLDIFRASVAAAALGFARRALAEAIDHAKKRKMFGQTLADFQLTQAKLGEMAALIDAGALLTYRAAWMRDTQQGDQRERSVAAAMAKMTATENAQRVIDMALQMHGGLGVMVGSKVESLYRDIRSLRIYEGATEVQQLIIGKAALQEMRK